MMQTNPIQLTNTNRFIHHYRNERKDVMDYFDYKPFDDFKSRLEYIDKRSYKRERLATILQTMNKKWDAPSSTLQQIERLQDETSVVVIGGQQAGLLTGPLYSINKLISIVHLAKEQETQLQRPVIPVFWIAGEDHDLDEINHIYVPNNHSIAKHRLHSDINNKTSVSHLSIDQDKAKLWLQTAFTHLQETDYTKVLYEKITACLEASSSYVDFFARLIFKLFPDEGIVLIDSADEDIRQLESLLFKQLITKQKEIATSVYKTVQSLQQTGYSIPLEAELDDAHLFFHDNYNERILLKREGENWVGKNDEINMSTEELMSFATNNPKRLSNNVVSRPLAQEYLFPTLAFIGGDGEISYWAALKDAFHHLSYQMPPVVPRISFTYQTERMAKLLRTRVLDVKDVIENGLGKVRLNWLVHQTTPPIERLFQEVHEKITQVHTPLHHMAKEISPDLEAETVKNLEYIQGNIDYLQRKVKQKLSEQYNQQLLQFDEIENTLKPNGTFQERIWSPLPFVNEYGVEFLRLLINDKHLSIKEAHYIVKL